MLAGLEGAFESSIGKEDVAAAKPDPEAYLLAAPAARASSRGEAVAIEDSPSGVAAALCRRHPLHRRGPPPRVRRVGRRRPLLLRTRAGRGAAPAPRIEPEGRLTRPDPTPLPGSVHERTSDSTPTTSVPGGGPAAHVQVDRGNHHRPVRFADSGRSLLTR